MTTITYAELIMKLRSATPMSRLTESEVSASLVFMEEHGYVLKEDRVEEPDEREVAVRSNREIGLEGLDPVE